MKPLNRPERRIAFMKFLGVFLLAVAIVIFSAFVAGVKIPPSAQSKQGLDCRERAILGQYIDTLAMQTAILKNLDKQVSDAKNEIVRGEKLELVKNEENNLRNLVRRIGNLKTDLPEKEAVREIGDAYLLLRSFPEKAGRPDQAGGDCESWKARLQDANDRIGQLKDIAGNASDKLEGLKIRLFNLNKRKTQEAINAVLKNLDETGNVQKVPEY